MAVKVPEMSDARLKEINTALGLIMQQRELANKMETCEWSTDEERAYLDATERKLLAVKAEFFPHKG